MNTSSLSLHATQRTKQRTMLTDSQIISLIKTTNVVIQRELGSNGGKEFKLFYSYPDNRYFIAVVNADSGVVITVMYEQYDIVLNHPITDEQKAQAVIDNSSVNQSDKFRQYFPDLYKTVKSTKKPSKFHILVYSYNENKVLGNPRTISSIGTRGFDYDPCYLIKSGYIETIFKKMCGNPEDIGMVMIKLGKYGKDIYIFDKVDGSYLQRVK